VGKKVASDDQKPEEYSYDMMHGHECLKMNF